MTQLRVVEGDAGMCQLIVSWMAITVKTSSQISDSISVTVEANVYFLEGDKHPFCANYMEESLKEWERGAVKKRVPLPEQG